MRPKQKNKKDDKDEKHLHKISLRNETFTQHTLIQSQDIYTLIIATFSHNIFFFIYQYEEW